MLGTSVSITPKMDIKVMKLEIFVLQRCSCKIANAPCTVSGQHCFVTIVQQDSIEKTFLVITCYLQFTQRRVGLYIISYDINRRLVRLTA